MALLAGAAARADDPVFIELVSQTAHGFSAEGRSQGPAVTGDGHAVAFNSNAINLLSPPLRNAIPQVYSRNLPQALNRLISISPADQPGNFPSSATGNLPSGFAPGISGDGRFVAFSSRATNLVPDDTNGFEDVFVYDTLLDSMELISRGIGGAPANSLSSFPRISGDGVFVVFQSNATNLVADDNNQLSDIFLFDRANHVMQRVSVALDGGASNGASITPNISEDGHFVAYASRATNLVAQATSGAFEQIFITDWENQINLLASVSGSGTPGNAISFLPDLTSDGKQVAFKSEAFNLVPGDTNGVPDVFVRDTVTQTTQRVSVDSFGNESNGLSGGPGISGDGRFVAFISFSSTFVPEDGNGFSDVYVYDRFPPGRDKGSIARVTVGIDGAEPNEGVPDFPVAISSDGRWIGFASAASNLVPNDINNEIDTFLACNPFDATQCAEPITPTPTPTEGVHPCVGDCNGDGQVTIDDLIRMVNIALGLRSVCGDDGGVGQCLAGDANCDCEITVDEIIRAVNNSLNGCTDFTDCTLEQEEAMCCEAPLSTPTPSPTPTPPMPCTTPDDCPPGQLCIDGHCVEVTPTATPTPSGPIGPCVGDCTGNGTVTIDELIRMVNIALGLQTLCPGEDPGCLAGDATCDCEITVDDIIKAVNNSLNGCTTFVSCSPAQHETMCCAP